MRIVYLAAGAAGMYCGSCLHDNALASALLKAGEDVLLVPTYTPLRTDEKNVSEERVFFGGVNVYLQQRFRIFRHTPWIVDKLLDLPSLIRIATRRSSSLDATRLGDLTVSMLAGDEGNQRKELQKLVHWLKVDVRPDIIHLSNALLLGMVDGIRQLGAPIVCSLSGEDVFFERLPAPYANEARLAMQARAKHVQAFVALNRYYADKMATALAAPPERVHVIRHGIGWSNDSPRPVRGENDPAAIGFFARICHDKGLHQLVEACGVLDRDANTPPFVVRAAGYLSRSDNKYLSDIQSQAKKWRHPERFQYVGELTLDDKIRFLRSLDLLCVPTVYRESKGLSLIEGLALGTPIVVPGHGAFPELVADTGGGVLFEPDNVADLAGQLKRMLLDPGYARRLGSTGASVVQERYRAEHMAQETLALYRRLLSDGPQRE